jgi:hypothetical protein
VRAMPVITPKWLKVHGACPDQVAIVRKHWPKGATLTLVQLRRAARLGLSLSWLAERVLNPAQRAVWGAALVKANLAWDAAMAEPNRVRAAALAKADRAWNAASADLDRVWAWDAAMAEPDRACDAAGAEAERAWNAAIAEALWVALHTGG